jgi:hypothetical protein
MGRSFGNRNDISIISDYEIRGCCFTGEDAKMNRKTMEVHMKWDREKLVNMVGESIDEKRELIMLSNYDLFNVAKERSFVKGDNPFPYTKQLKMTEFTKHETRA